MLVLEVVIRMRFRRLVKTSTIPLPDSFAWVWELPQTLLLPAASVNHCLKQQAFYEARTFASQLILYLFICIVFTWELRHFDTCQTLQDKFKGKKKTKHVLPHLHLYLPHRHTLLTQSNSGSKDIFILNE